MQTYIFRSLGHKSKSGISGSYGITFFINILRNYKTLFQTSCTISYYHWQFMKFLICLHPWCHLLWSIFLIIAILVAVKWHLVALTCIYLMISNVKHILMIICCLYIFFREMSIQILYSFFIRMFVFCQGVLWVLNTFCILEFYEIYDLKISPHIICFLPCW